jgi:Flp pilus assembly protein TadB
VVEPPAAEELAVWVARLQLGADPVAVWAAMGRHDQFGRLGTALRRSAESGAPVTAALGRLAEDLRARRRADVEGRVRQVEVRAAVPLGVCLLPAFVLVGVVPLVAGSVLGLLGTR